MLRSEGISLRALQSDDAETVASLINNRKVLDNLRDYIPYPYSKKDAEEFILFSTKQDPTVTFAILSHDEICGVIAIIPQSDIHRMSAEVGYWIGEPYWGNGIATQALSLITEYAFSQLDVIRLYAIVFSPNDTSKRVLEKCGYKKEGIGKKAIIKNNQILDEHRYAILKSDYLN
ncbi:MAG: GNAT family protein [Ekhidna sp.]